MTRYGNGSITACFALGLLMATVVAARADALDAGATATKVSTVAKDCAPASRATSLDVHRSALRERHRKLFAHHKLRNAPAVAAAHPAPAPSSVILAGDLLPAPAHAPRDACANSWSLLCPGAQLLGTNY